MSTYVSVWISGKAWDAEPWGNDPYYECPNADVRAVLASAYRRRQGRGFRVRLIGVPDALEELANWYECDGEAWLLDRDPEQMSDARACVDAAKAIRRAIQEQAR